MLPYKDISIYIAASKAIDGVGVDIPCAEGARGGVDIYECVWRCGVFRGYNTDRLASAHL